LLITTIYIYCVVPSTIRTPVRVIKKGKKKKKRRKNRVKKSEKKKKLKGIVLWCVAENFRLHI
jgi:hypothetical protein